VEQVLLAGLRESKERETIPRLLEQMSHKHLVNLHSW
jgi:hypothetical protein